MPRATATTPAEKPASYRRGQEVEYVTTGRHGRSSPRVGRYQGRAQTATGVFLEIRTPEGRRVRVRPSNVQALD